MSMSVYRNRKKEKKKKKEMVSKRSDSDEK